MIIKPNFYTYDYDPKKVLKVKDTNKQRIYIAFGMHPCDIYVDSNGDLIMLFEKSILT